VPLDVSLKSSLDTPHTISEIIRLREMLDSFNELPKDKRPPEDIWFSQEELEDWFDRAFGKDKQTEFVFDIEDIES
jgi:hypothetical protein